jgi:hypothetical protein
MGRKQVMAKISTINRATAGSSAGLERYCRNLENWPNSWMGWEKDLPPGRVLVACFRPFLEHLVRSDLSHKTIQKHVDNIWVLGGEIIRDLNQTPSLRKVPVERLLADLIEDGGPLLYHGDSEEQQKSFESTCRKFRRFLLQQAAR